MGVAGAAGLYACQYVFGAKPPAKKAATPEPTKELTVTGADKMKTFTEAHTAELKNQKRIEDDDDDTKHTLNAEMTYQHLFNVLTSLKAWETVEAELLKEGIKFATAPAASTLASAELTEEEKKNSLAEEEKKKKEEEEKNKLAKEKAEADKNK